MIPNTCELWWLSLLCQIVPECDALQIFATVLSLGEHFVCIEPKLGLELRYHRSHVEFLLDFLGHDLLQVSSSLLVYIFGDHLLLFNVFLLGDQNLPCCNALTAGRFVILLILCYKEVGAYRIELLFESFNLLVEAVLFG